MSKTLKKNKVISDFVVSEFNEEIIVFNRKIKNKGRSAKKIKEIQSSLPTATILYFPYEEYTKLKDIESNIKILDKIEKENQEPAKGRSSLLKLIYDFLEI